VVVEQEVVVEDVVWAVVAAAAVVAVEEDVVAEASDRPNTQRPGLRTTIVWKRPRLDPKFVLDQTEGQTAIHTINCVPNSREQDIIKGRPYQRSKTRFVVAAKLATGAQRKILPTRNSSTSAYLRLLLPFYFYELQKKENANLFYDQDPMGFSISHVQACTNSRTFTILSFSISSYCPTSAIETLPLSGKQLFDPALMVLIHKRWPA
jgi:hypothetical protein